MNDDVVVVQLTGRMHFGAARGFERGGRLAALVTDFHLPGPLKALASLSDALKPYNIALPSQKVRGSPMVGLAYRWGIRRLGHFHTQTHIDASRALARQADGVMHQVDASTIFSFDIQALETFQVFEGSGKKLVLEQCVAPRKSQMELLKRLKSRFKPFDYDRRVAQLITLSRREMEEWRLAHVIVCPSDYVKDELIFWGADASKIRVVPYGFSQPKTRKGTPQRNGNVSTPSAMFVGTVDPRKGLQDVVSAVQLLDEGSIHLDVFGSLGRTIREEFDASSIKLHGKVPFARINRAYAQADIFVLPSYLEGSATVVYEAMSHGLPCIVSPETGSVVRDGIDGFIVPAGDVRQIADRLSQLTNDPQLRRKMGEAATSRASSFTFEKYGERLCTVL